MNTMPLADGSVTIASVVRRTSRQFAEAGLATPGLDAKVLVGGLLGIGLTQLVLDARTRLDDVASDRIAKAAARRVRGEPVHRILGRREFYGLDLHLNGHTLEPRPDTETVVDAALPVVTVFAQRPGGCSVLDLGTGTGAIALALLSEVANARALGVDISDDAVRMALENARRNGLGDRFSAQTSDWFEKISGRYDVIAANPPYICRNDMEKLPEEVLRFDPAAALDGGLDGLDAYRIISKNAGDHLNPGGRIILETGFDQHEAVIGLFRNHGFACLERRRDLGGRDRVLVFGSAGSVAETHPQKIVIRPTGK